MIRALISFELSRRWQGGFCSSALDVPNHTHKIYPFSSRFSYISSLIYLKYSHYSSLPTGRLQILWDGFGFVVGRRCKYYTAYHNIL